ncbi:MAG TPA: efflux RND transporter periplasmic adaptor subunit [Phycisphaerae bacterium]
MRTLIPGASPLCAAAWVSFLVSLALAAGCKRHEAPAPPPAPAVTVARPVQREVIEWDEYTGRLDAVESVEVRARVSGLIISAPFGEGALVKQGDLLFEIDVRPFQAELDSRLADVAKAEAQVALAQVEFKRIKNLLPDNATELEFDTAKANLQQAQAALAAAQAAVDAARLNVEWCRVTAPISGRISRKNVTPGNLITGGTGTGTLLTSIMSIDPIYCYVDVDEQSVLKYQRLSREKKRVSARDARIPCFLQLGNETGFPHEGVVDFVDNRIDPGTATIRARGVFPNAEGWLTPGFFGRMRVPGSGRYETLLVPDSAVTTDQSQKLLLVLGPDNTIATRAVKLGALFGELRSIESGLSPDDLVVINGQMQARPGTKVKPREEPISVASFQLTAPGSPTTQALPAAREPADHEQATTSATQPRQLATDREPSPTTEDPRPPTPATEGSAP